MDEYFFYTQLQGWEWEDEDKGLVNLTFRTDLTETHSETFNLRLDLNNHRLTCPDKEIREKKYVALLLQHDDDYIRNLVDKINRKRSK
ncbi:hypothetical protein [Sporolactobacillus inulinus]|jgi:hypothetical protein|uniref:Uncharacterized protein n=1 Tax=Sporolactobacillus inulinus CASD TaxID=1069536 RepID=A0A0U1QNN5_9BACL|nr:hypothetical protein [Sporolactobacillus inulinus]KLI02418.1 hypothetical protein SINU_08125 [Sporolactobacillus inulinus CASD]GEB76843.1 hypothetical protein SIN01_11880 [Sporolactobacillus inulinus]